MSRKYFFQQKKSTACLDFSHPRKFNKNQTLGVL